MPPHSLKTTDSSALAEILAHKVPTASRLWGQAKSSRHARLLRMAILRDLARSFHTMRSEAMATGESHVAAELTRYESSICDHFADLAGSELGLEELLEKLPAPHQSKDASAAKPNVSPEVFAHVPEEKLMREDRRWEAALAEEARRSGWKFWRFECWLEIPRVEAWARELSDALWPCGIVLFVESDGFRKSPSLWRGKWTLLVDPSVRAPEELGLDLSSLPSASEARWTS